jgi:hypothetical protein
MHACSVDPPVEGVTPYLPVDDEHSLGETRVTVALKYSTIKKASSKDTHMKSMNHRSFIYLSIDKYWI